VKKLKVEFGYFFVHYELEMDICKSIGTKTLYPHQLHAVQWMIEREKDGGGLICDEMGLGKTLTSIALLLTNIVSKTLILGPLAVIDQWISVLKTTSLAIYGVNKGKWTHIQGNKLFGSVYISNYDKLTGKNDLFTQHPWDRILCDEAHILRNYDSKKYLALDTLKATNKWLLTGTPVVNHIRDLGSLIHLIHKKVSPKLATIEKGHGWMQKFALQRTVQQVRDALPDIMPREPLVFHHRLDFETDEEATFYRAIQGAIVQNLQQMIDNDHIDIYVFLELILRLRQISTHPQVYIQSRRRKIGGYRRPDWTGTSTKTNGILNILRSEKQHHGYVIFCHFNDEMELLKKILEKEGSVGKVFIYNGSLSPEQRTNVIQDTKNHINSLDVINGGYILDEFPHLRQLPGDILKYVIQPFLGPQHTVLLAQIQTAGTGLNLQHMDRVIFTSSWWTAALMDQAVSRVVRIGQTKDVHVHHVILNEEDNLSINIDDYIHERVEMKRELCNELLLSANHTI